MKPAHLSLAWLGVPQQQGGAGPRDASAEWVPCTRSELTEDAKCCYGAGREEAFEVCSEAEHNAAYIARLHRTQEAPEKWSSLIGWLVKGPKDGSCGVRYISFHSGTERPRRFEPGSLLHISNDWERFSPVLSYKDTEALVVACGDALEHELWEGMREVDCESIVQPSDFVWKANAFSKQGGLLETRAFVRNPGCDDVHGPFTIEQMRAMYVYSGVQFLRGGCGQRVRVEDDTDVAECWDDEFDDNEEWVGGPFSETHNGKWDGEPVLLWIPISARWEYPQTQAFLPDVTRKAMYAAASVSRQLKRLARDRRQRIFELIFRRAGLEPPLSSARFLRLLGTRGPGVGGQPYFCLEPITDKGDVHPMDRVL
tara:strand:- start:407 stop:1513 length:1107 start_codon:yes stop_codon:yes gene_type:complete